MTNLKFGSSAAVLLAVLAQLTVAQDYTGGTATLSSLLSNLSSDCVKSCATSSFSASGCNQSNGTCICSTNFPAQVSNCAITQKCASNTAGLASFESLKQNFYNNCQLKDVEDSSSDTATNEDNKSASSTSANSTAAAFSETTGNTSSSANNVTLGGDADVTVLPFFDLPAPSNSTNTTLDSEIPNNSGKGLGKSSQSLAVIASASLVLCAGYLL